MCAHELATFILLGRELRPEEEETPEVEEEVWEDRGYLSITTHLPLTVKPYSHSQIDSNFFRKIVRKEGLCHRVLIN